MRTNTLTLITATALSIGLGQMALAADLPARPAYQAPAMVVPVSTWSGCYVGGNVGASWGGGSISGSGGGTASGSSNAGFTGGGQFGCDYQTGALVIGIRNLINWSDLSFNSTLAAGGSIDVKNNWVDLLTGRLGYAVQPNWLLYFQGGGAWTHGTVQQFNGAGTQIGQTDRNRTGWTVGGGSEYKFTPNWSVFVEYNYASFGSKQVTLPSGTLLGVSTNPSLVLFGANYRF